MPFRFRREHVPEYTGVAVAVVYGVVLRILFGLGDKVSWIAGVMTWSFIAVLPFAMGFFAAFWAEWHRPSGLGSWLARSITPVLLSSLFVFALGLEGAICLVFLLPIALVAGVIGGLVGGFTARKLHNRRGKQPVLSCVLLVPIACGFAEQNLSPDTQVRHVENSVVIASSPEQVWRNIVRVPMIARSEYHESWVNRIGFPRPLEATLSHEGVGGVRHASFERHVVFIETVDAWEPQRHLAFSIRADDIPASTLDEHATIGGRYFDVLHGSYVIEPIDAHHVRLRLSSEQRLSTDFNWYAHYWSDAVMSDIQRNILRVIKRRAETAGDASPSEELSEPR